MKSAKSGNSYYEGGKISFESLYLGGDSSSYLRQIRLLLLGGEL